MSTINEENFLTRIKAGEKIEAEDPMPEKYRQALLNTLESSAEGELTAAYICGALLAKIPSLDDKKYAAQALTEEIRHAALFYKCMEELGADTEQLVRNLDEACDFVFINPKKHISAAKRKELLKSRSVQRMSPVDRFETWFELTAYGVCIERAVLFEAIAGQDCSYNPLVRTYKEIIKDEIGHVTHADARFEKFAKNPETRTAIQQALYKYFPRAMSHIEAFNSPKVKINQEWGLRPPYRENKNREVFYKEVEEVVLRAGLQMPLWPDHHKKKNGIINKLSMIKKKVLSLSA